MKIPLALINCQSQEVAVTPKTHINAPYFVYFSHRQEFKQNQSRTHFEVIVLFFRKTRSPLGETFCASVWGGGGGRLSERGR